jgi:hypothetical protein
VKAISRLSSKPSLRPISEVVADICAEPFFQVCCVFSKCAFLCLVEASLQCLPPGFSAFQRIQDLGGKLLASFRL